VPAICTYDANGNLTYDGRQDLEIRWNVHTENRTVLEAQIRILHTGFRQGDTSEMVLVEFADFNEAAPAAETEAPAAE